jgi:hypothetical protein
MRDPSDHVGGSERAIDGLHEAIWDVERCSIVIGLEGVRIASCELIGAVCAPWSLAHRTTRPNHHRPRARRPRDRTNAERQRRFRQRRRAQHAHAKTIGQESTPV